MDSIIQDLQADVERLKSENNKMSSQIIDYYLQAVEMLSMLAESEDRFFEDSHIRFVANKSVEVARLLGMKEKDIFELKIAATLHDIGKIALPDSIRSKFRAELAPDEFKMYSYHPLLGQEMLNKHKGFDRIAKIVAQHHERLDGSGFPHRLRESDIMPGALIIAVVDIYHNTVSRKARERYTKNEQGATVLNTASFLSSNQARVKQALNHLQAGARVLYNAQVVTVFTDIIELERQELGGKMLRRLSINQLKAGMVIADNYFTSYGILIASKGEVITPKMVSYLMQYADRGELSAKVLAFASDEDLDKEK